MENIALPKPDSLQPSPAAAPVQPSPPPQIQPLQPPAANTPPRRHGHVIFYVISFVTLLAGLLIGYLMRQTLSQNAATQAPAPVPVKTADLVLPSDAQKIDDCVTHEGALYVKPKDIPQGPLYMVHNSKVVGLEYMVPKDKILNNGILNLPGTQNIHLDHVDIAPESNGHAGFSVNHYHINLFIVDKNTQMSITCPNGGSQEMNMPGMNMYEATVSAMPSGSMQMMPANGSSH